MIEGWSDAAIIEEVLCAPTRFGAGLPDTEVIVRPGWHPAITPSLKTGGFNDVSLAVLAPEEVEATIDRVLASYRSHGAVLRWFVGPDSRPADLGERLAARGLERSEVLAMARAIAPTPDEVDADVEEIGLEGPGLADFTDVMAQGWGGDREVLLALHRALLEHPEGRHRLFLTRVDGVPAGAAGYIRATERTAYLVGAVVLTPFRARGLYRALVAARVNDARARGLALAVSHAGAATSAPILARQGFVTVARIACYRT